MAAMFVSAADLGDATLDCDIAIFGAGAAGISLADSLRTGRQRIVLVEGGTFDIESGAQALFSARSIGEPFSPNHGRYRVFGGAAVAWTGRCAMLDPQDLEPRPWLRDSDPPISFADLADPYRLAAQACGFETGWGADPAVLARVHALPDRPAAIAPFAWRFWGTARNCYQHWGERHYAPFRRSETLRVLLGTNLVGFETEPGGRRVNAATLRTIDGKQFTLGARQFVLCCGGIENARILLNVAEQTPALVDDVAPVLGRYFMQHPRATTASVTAAGAQAIKLQKLFNRFKRNRGLQFETGFSLSALTQAREGLVNASAILRYRRAPERWSAMIASRLRVDRMAEAAIRWRLGRVQILEPVIASLVVDLEQQPDRDSRIVLDGQRDGLGLRKAAIDWRIGPVERQTSTTLTRAVCRWIEHLGLGTANVAEDIESDGALRDDRLMESFHHLGTTRMSETPRTGVVDADLRVHGTDNLYVCGASSMPVGGHANPTLTIVALAMRLGDHLKAL
ncbi:GMC family oxidoreductase [Sphingomonas koreensis]|nr:GMC family oxidoreductase [Sphingomonas koreensis]